MFPNDFIDKILVGDALEVLKTFPDEFVDCVITSPPYWGLRDYGVEGQIGLEKTPEEYVERLVNVFREVKRVLKKTGTFWLVIGDSYFGGGFGHQNTDNDDFAERYPKQASNRGTFGSETRKILNNIRTQKHPILKPKDLVGIPWRVAFALQQDGWILRQDIIWAKPNPMPESVKDRCTRSHEYIFLLTKSPQYYFDSMAIKEPSITKEPRGGSSLNDTGWTKGAYGKSPSKSHPNSWIEIGRNKRDVWWVSTKPFKGAHFATFPPDLIEPMILAGCPEVGIVLDPFMGAGTTALVAKKLGRHYIGIELNPEYVKMANERIEEAMK